MRFSYVQILHVIAAGLFGLGFLLLPHQMAGIYGVQTDTIGIWLARYFGAALVGIALLSFFLRDLRDAPRERQLAIGYLVYTLIGLLVTLWFVFSPEGTAMLWLTAAVYALLAVGYALVLARRESPAPLTPAAPLPR